ncbi:hypothetical protein JOC55_001222 [Paenibacillus sacheonensis]|nr:hypothetical protein [Paenibacillus sacheonensis]
MNIKRIGKLQLAHYESEIRFVTEHFEDWISDVNL